jgi:3-phenylpropionate/cinnamic acid dioxygenase small subunit
VTSSPHEAIRNLLGTYCELMDAADWAGVGELFERAELVAENGAVVAAGADGIRTFYERGTKLYDGSPRTRHVTSNTVIELDGDTATARSAFVVFQQAPKQQLQPIITGRYRDRFACDETGWRFAQRMFLVDQVGDLSHHLSWELST